MGAFLPSLLSVDLKLFEKKKKSIKGKKKKGLRKKSVSPLILSLQVQVQVQDHSMGWQASHSLPWPVPPRPCRAWQPLPSVAVPTVPPKLASLPSSEPFLRWPGKTPASSCTDRWACAETTSSLVLPTQLSSLSLPLGEEEHWEESPLLSDPPGHITGKSLVPALGTSPGHFDVVFWLVLGPASLLLCPGLSCVFFPRLQKP